MERSIICLAVSIMIFVFSPAHAFTLFAEVETDRPGCDFKNFVVPGANDANSRQTFVACMNACGLDTNCQAWSFDARSGTGRCFLKNNTCGATASHGTIAGFKLPATMSGTEPETDRVGCDFASFPAKNPLRGITCAEDSRCQAWNFDARSGAPTCFLKNCVPPPTIPAERPNEVTSGVKFPQGGVATRPLP
jgi:hypothetical protein